MKKQVRIILISAGFTCLAASVVIYIWRMNVRAGRSLDKLLIEDSHAYDIWNHSRWPVYILAGLGLTLLWLVFGGALDKMMQKKKREPRDF